MPRIFIPLAMRQRGRSLWARPGAPTASPPRWDAKSDWPLGVSIARRNETISACLAHTNKSLAQMSKSGAGISATKGA